MELDRIRLHLAGDTIRKLMRELNVQVSLYNRHRNGKYSSYRDRVGNIADKAASNGRSSTLFIFCCMMRLTQR
ncbi:hypothetical protein LMB50_06705 [Limosilactobacillus reuteri]|nr:hypothetical protein [Limosilactobacillus reuteri]